MGANYICKKEAAIKKMKTLISKWKLQHVIIDGHIYGNTMPAPLNQWENAMQNAQNEITFV